MSKKFIRSRAKSAFPHTLLRRQVFSAVSVQTPLFQEGFLIFCTSKNTTLKWTIRGQYVRIIYIWDTRSFLKFCFIQETGKSQYLLFFFFPFFIRYLAHLHFQCYTKSPPYPPTPTPLPAHSPFLALAFPCSGAYKVCVSNGPLFPVMAD